VICPSAVRPRFGESAAGDGGAVSIASGCKLKSAAAMMSLTVCNAAEMRRPDGFYIGMIRALGSRRRRSFGSLVIMGSRRSLARITTDASMMSDELVAP
jgi:hypothetical protein